ncbi:oligosaccharide flippase family protein [Patescibacteria group bacterium]
MKEKLVNIFNLGKTQTAKNTYIVFIGNTIAGLLGVLPMILISRKLGPVGFGAFSVAFALLTLMAKLGDFGLDFSLVKNISESRVKHEEVKIEKFFWSSFWFKFMFAIIYLVFGLIFSRQISIGLFKSPESVFYNKEVFVLSFLFVFYVLLKVYFQANKKFLKSSLMYVVGNLIKLITVGLVFVFLPSFKNYILVYMLAPFLSALFFFRFSKLKLKFKFYPKEFKQLTGFASWMSVSVLFAALGENLNIFMVSARLNEFETGIYSAAEKFILPVSLLTAALATVLTSRASEFLEIKHIKSFIKKIMLLQVFMFIIFLVAIPFARFIPLILSSQYQNSVIVLQVLIIANFFRSAITPLNSVFYPLNKPIIFAIDSILQFFMLFILNQYFIPIYGAKGAAMSLVLVNIVIFTFNYLFLFYLLKRKAKVYA